MHDPMITETLRRVPLFAGLSEEQLEYVQQGNEIRLRSGDYVKRAGDPPDGFYIVIEGQTRVDEQGRPAGRLRDDSGGRGVLGQRASTHR